MGLDTGPITAFAPATVANVAVGFDVLGFALEGVGDRVTVAKVTSSTEVSIKSIEGVVPDLPTDPDRNTASVALQALVRTRRLNHGFSVAIDKGIPLGSGMGGSAASAVGAVVAANRFLDLPLSTAELLPLAVAGEQAASGSPHADNAAPCLYGGMTALVGQTPPAVVSIPVPPELLCVLVHPHLRITTKEARASLAAELPLEVHVAQSMRLCGFLAGCFRGDLALVGRSMVDLVAEPSRARRLPGFGEAREAALGAGAIGFGIAGSGPSVFAWADSRGAAESARVGIKQALKAHGVDSDGWIGPVGAPGAAVVTANR